MLAAYLKIDVCPIRLGIDHTQINPKVSQNFWTRLVCRPMGTVNHDI